MKKRWIVLCAMVLTCLCVGCGSAEQSQLKTTCQDFFNAYSALDGETAGALISGNKVGITFSELQGALSQHISAQIKSVSENENTAVATVVVSNVDVAEVFENIPQSIGSREEAKTYLIQAFSEEDVPMTKFELELSLVKEDENWLIRMTPALSDALLGGYNTLVDTVLETAVD